jgi:hypothetical protein
MPLRLDVPVKFLKEIDYYAKPLRRSLGRNARRHIHEECSTELHVDRLLTFVGRLER